MLTGQLPGREIVGIDLSAGMAARARNRAAGNPLVPALEGATLERDELLSFPMVHPDADTFFTAHTRSGPMRPLADARGEEFIAVLREEFLRRAPEGEWRHRPSARHIVARA